MQRANTITKKQERKERAIQKKEKDRKNHEDKKNSDDIGDSQGEFGQL